MVRYLAQEEKIKCKEFWKDIFEEDSETFIQYYFEEKIKDNQILVLEHQERLDAMLHLNPYRLYVKKQEWKIDYIVGVATRADRRHRGYMRMLLEAMMKDMYQKRVPFTFLMPAHPDIYRPFQFTYIFDQPKWNLNSDEMITRKRCNQEDFGIVATWMNQWLLEKYEVFAIRDEEYVQGLLKELGGELGYLDVLYQDGVVVGVEGMWGAQNPQQRCLLADTNLIEEVKRSPAIMARIICLEEMVKVICLNEQASTESYSFTIEVTDPKIIQNTGIWEWNLTKTTSHVIKKESAPKDRIILTIEELTQWIFGYQIPPQVAHLQDMVRVLQGVFLDEVV